MNTNISYGADSTPVTWASRPRDNYFSFAERGQSYENMIRLANTACKDLWINIPVYATDDWALGMAQLLKANLNPKLHVYYEFCNEDWNWSFGQWQVVENLAVANPYLNEAKDGAWYCHGEETAVLLMHFANIMQPVLGSQGRPILAGQASYNLYTTAGLEWIQKTLGPPSQYIYGIAGAPYFADFVGDGTETDLDTIFNNVLTGFSPSGFIYQIMQQSQSLANQYNIKNCCYESGQSLTLAAQQDPRMGVCYQKFADLCNATGVDTCCFFNFVNDWGKYGNWGALTDVREVGTNPTIKYTAEAQAALNGRPSCNCSTSSSNSNSSHNNFSNHPGTTPMMTKAQMQAWAAQLAAQNKAKAAAAAAAAAGKQHNIAPRGSASNTSGMTKSQLQHWASELAAKNAAKTAASKKKTP